VYEYNFITYMFHPLVWPSGWQEQEYSYSYNVSTCYNCILVFNTLKKAT